MPSARKNVLTTGEVARICQVAPRTISKWVDCGKLKGYKIPGGDRRVPRASLLRFLKDHGMQALSPGLDGRRRVLFVGAPESLARRAAADLGEDDFDFAAAATGFEAGLLADSFGPDCVALDTAMGRSEACAIAGHLRAKDPAVRLVALAGEDEGDAPGLTACGFDAVLCRPFDPADLAAALRPLLAR